MFKKNSRKKIYVIHKQELTKDNIFIIVFNSYFKCTEKRPERNIQDYG